MKIGILFVLAVSLFLFGCESRDAVSTLNPERREAEIEKEGVKLAKKVEVFDASAAWSRDNPVFRIKGRLLNKSDKAITSVKMRVVIYDKHKNPVDSETFWVSDLDIAPGLAQRFDGIASLRDLPIDYKWTCYVEKVEEFY